jgi:hypothetical protein
MNWKALINLKGLNYWLLASGVGLNLVWTFGLVLVMYRLLITSRQGTAGLQLGLMIGAFAGAFLVALFIGKWAADNRGPTYGLVGSLGSALFILIIMLPAGGLLGLLVAVMTLTGGLNGGLVTLKSQRPPRS